MARDLAAVLRAPLAASTVSRLLVDLNRSLSNPRAWSAATRSLQPAEKAAPHRALLRAPPSQGRGYRRRRSNVGTPGHPPRLAQLYASAERTPSNRRRRPLVRSRATRRDAARPVVEGRARRTGASLARATQLSVCREGGRTHQVLAAAISACVIRRNRDRAQPGVRAGGRQSVARSSRIGRRNVAGSAWSSLRCSNEVVAGEECCMKIRIGYDMVYACPQPVPMILMLNTHYSRASDVVVPGSRSHRSRGAVDRLPRRIRKLVHSNRRSGRRYPHLRRGDRARHRASR